MTHKKRGRRGPRKNTHYSPAFRLRAVKLYLEEGYTATLVTEELGIGKSTLSKWVLSTIIEN